MRAKSWRQDLDRQATLDAYLKAKTDGATELALRIRVANATPEVAESDDLSAQFDAIDKHFPLLPVA